MWGVKENNNNIGAFAWSNERWASVVRNLSFANDRSRIFERIPVMNVSRRFGDFIRCKQSNVVSRKVASDAVKRAIEAIAESIVKEVSGIDSDTGSVM